MLVSIICRAPEAYGQLANIIIAATLSEGRGGRDPFPHVNSWKVGTESTVIEQWTTERYKNVFYQYTRQFPLLCKARLSSSPA